MTDNYSDFVSRNDRKKFLILLIIAAIPLVGLSSAALKNQREELAEFSKSPVGLTLFLLFLLFTFGFFCFKYFLDTKDKIIINRDGICTPKYGLFHWQIISYIYLKETKGKVSERKVLVKLNEEDKEIRLDITYLDKTEEEIIDALKTYSEKYNVKFLDKEVQNVY